MSTKTTILLGAAAGAMMLLGASGAWTQTLPECNTGQLTGAAWTTVTEPVGSDSTTCYAGGSGNEVDCESEGNHVQVTRTAGSVDTRQHSNPNQNCVIAGSEQEGSCDISRTGGTGNTDFDYCD
jgi:hypothetical protein